MKKKKQNGKEKDWRGKRNVGTKRKKVRSEDKEARKIEKRTGRKWKSFESKVLMKVPLI